MHDIRKINVMENIMDENDHIAEHVNEHMSAHGVLVINEMGAPGVGKTTTLRNIISRLDGIKPYVIEGDIESDLDTQTLKGLGIDTHQINTFGACHLDAPMIDHMIDHMHFDHSEQRAGTVYRKHRQSGMPCRIFNRRAHQNAHIHSDRGQRQALQISSGI